MDQRIQFEKAMSSRGFVMDTMKKNEAMLALNDECRCD